MDRGHYVLMTGEKGEAQLDALDNTFGVESRKFLNQLKIEQRQLVADVGCGVGNLTLWMAEQVAPNNGKVIGIDSSEDQIRVAQRRAKERSIKNVEFKVLPAQDLSALPQEFDLVYCRWVLIHLLDPQKVIQQMCQRLKIHGIFACEESTLNRFSVPNYEWYITVFNWINNMLAFKGCDIEIGSKIFNFITQKFKNFKPHMKLNQIVITDPAEIANYAQRIKILLTSMTPALLDFKQVSAEQIAALMQQIENATPQLGDFIAMDRMNQFWAERIS